MVDGFVFRASGLEFWGFGLGSASSSTSYTFGLRVDRQIV